MTPAQLITLNTAILADPVFAPLGHNSDGAFEIASAFNLTAVPDFYVWRISVPTDEIMSNGFGWDRVDNLTAGKARIWEWMMLTGSLNFNVPNVRSGVLAVFSTASDLATRLAAFTHGQRKGTRAEKLFSVGAGTSTTDQGLGPATTSLETPVTYQDVMTARGWT